MVKISVCDDETKIIEDIKRIIEKEITDAEISAYTDGDSLLKRMEEDKYDIVLLDIDMPGMSGMDVAASMAENKKKSLIVFVTAHDELVYDSFRYHPFAFVRKTYLEEELIAVLKDCQKEIESKESHFLFKSEGKNISILTQDILYFEAEANYLVIHEKNAVYRMRSTMTNVENSLRNDGFVRIHKGFLVNQEHIRTMNMEEVTLDTGEKLPMGKSYANEAKTSILRYMRK